MKTIKGISPTLVLKLSENSAKQSYKQSCRQIEHTEVLPKTLKRTFERIIRNRVYLQHTININSNNSKACKLDGSSLSGSMAANNIPPSAFDKEQIFGMAEKEMEYRVELFNKMTQTCFNKCVDNRYKESELNMGENSCIDRCVSKYWHVTNLIGQLLGSGRPPM
ncbi:hypothetical protein VNO77_29063 [Canavalia gladiata]|uniref:Tim10-like domain-containing protein n=1 Tax=Canavalia gladiata TaxID=3824 RepID=A0AAN9KWQ5_CANGL